MKQLKKCFLLFLAVCLLATVCAPQPNVKAATNTVTIKYKGKKTTYKKKKTKILVNDKKISLTKYPIFMKEGSYMGPAAKIFNSSSLKVKYKSSSNNKTLVLTYNNHVLKMTSGSKKATLDGKKTEFGTAPFYATYVTGGYNRWIVPLKSVCTRLGIDYKLGSDGVIRLNGDPNDTTVNTEETTAVSASQQDKFVLCLDAGHGGADSGALGNGKAEKNMTLAIIKAAKKYFDKDDRFKVVYTRTSDTYPSLQGRCKVANDADADLFISVHINSAASTSTGSETLYNPDRNTATKKNGITSKELATYMQKALVETTAFPDRGIVKRSSRLKNGLRVLNDTKMPACLLEYGFISNKKECLSMNVNLNRYGKELYQSIVSFLKEKGQIK